MMVQPSMCAFLAILFIVAITNPPSAVANDPVKTANGLLEGTLDQSTGIRSFKGIPFAAAPVGNLRWKEPQPVTSWKDVRKADKFGPRAYQPPIFDDMV